MPPSTLTADIERLQASVTSLLALISHCQSSISTLSTTTTTTAISSPSPPAPTAGTPTTGTITPPSIPPLALLHDTASLAKAHTTKLSLLLTQSSLSSTCRALPPILTAIQTTILPPLLTTLQLLTTHHYGKTLHHAVSHPISEILHGITDLVGGPLKSMVDTARSRGARAGKEEPTSAEKEKIILPCTGRIWGACDKLIALKAKGLNGLIIDRLESSKETLKDAEEELTAYMKRHSPCYYADYGAATSDEDDDEDGNKDDTTKDDTTKDDVKDDNKDETKADNAKNKNNDDQNGNHVEADADDLFWDDNDGDDLPSSLKPPNPGEKQKLLILHPKVSRAIASTLRRIKTTYILFNAIQKARLTLRVAPHPDPALTTTPDPEIVNRLDKIVDFAEELVALVDEVVGEYYDNEDFDYIPQEVIQGENQDPSELENVLIEKGMALSKLVETGWQNTTDPVTRLFEELGKAIKRGIDEL